MCEPESGPICQKWKAVGGEAGCGQSVGTPELVLDGKAVLQRFEKGAIFLTNSYGAIVISKPILDKWETLKAEPSLPGSSDDLQKYLGCPLKDTLFVPPISQVVYFERGMIVFEELPLNEFSGPRASVVYGWVYDHYRTLGDVTGALGLPTGSTKIDSTGGLVSGFKNGGIYWLDGVGGGAILNGSISFRWEQVGGLDGELGYPVTDEQPVRKNGQEIGRVSRFQNGAIYFSQATGAFEVKGPILKAWEEQFGGAAGELGFPVSGQRNAPTTNKIYNNFEHGVLVWDNDAPLEKRGLAVKKLEFFVQRFMGTGGDEVDSDGLEVYVNSSVGTNKATFFNGRLPAGDGFYAAEQDVNLVFAVPEVVTGETVVTFDFEGKDHDDHSDDDVLGRINDKKYTVDNGWELDKGLVQIDRDAFHMVCGMRIPGTPLDPDQSKFRAQGFWSFDNFTTDDLSKGQYANTFRDIDAGTMVNLNPATWLNESWEGIFYKLVYQDMAEPGNCFGMCVESIYAQVGRSFYTEPIFKFAFDAPGLVNEINIKHGYQCGASVIDWFVGQFLTASTHDPVTVFDDSQDAYERGDYPVISMSGSFFEAGGHVVRPYQWLKLTDDHWIMRVANPNNPAKSDTPTDNDAEGSVIHIDVDDLGINSGFRFERSPGKVWEGGQWFGSRMHYIPYSQLSETPRTPGYEVLALLALGAIVLVGSAGESHQISDESGSTFYEPNLEGPPKRWEEIRREGNTLLGSIARMPMFGGDGVPCPELYFVRDTGATLRHSIGPRPETPHDQPYHWLMRSPTLSAAIALQAASSVVDEVTIERTGTQEQALSLALSPAGSDRKAEMWLAGWRGLDGENQHWFHVHDLLLTPGHVVGMSLHEAGQELVLKNNGPGVTCKISIRDSNTREVVLEAGKATRIRPNWQQPDEPWLTEEATASLRHFMERRGLPPRLGVREYFPSAGSIRELIRA